MLSEIVSDLDAENGDLIEFLIDKFGRLLEEIKSMQDLKLKNEINHWQHK